MQQPLRRPRRRRPRPRLGQRSQKVAGHAQQQPLHRLRFHPHPIRTEPKQRLIARRQAQGRKMAAPLHQRQAAAGVPHRQEQLQLLLQRWRHQIQAAAHQQGGHPQIAQAPLGPQQRAETVEQHHPPQLRRARQGRRQRRRRQLTLQQQRQVGQGQPLHRPRTTAVQARLRLQARRH